MKDLETRLNEIDTNDIKQGIISQLANRRYEKAANINNPYYKYQLIESIIEKINVYDETEEKFISNFHSKVNKDEAKRVYYGLVCMGGYNPELGMVMERLSDWEKIFFFAGVWTNRKMRGIHSKSVKEIIGDYIKDGYDLLHKKHMIKFNQGKYKRELKLPESQDCKKNKRLEDRFNSLLAKEDGSYENSERTSIFLHGCSQNELRYLTKKFGEEVLGGYAIK